MLTDEHKLTNYETLKHIMKVRDYINVFTTKLLKRGSEHDASKLESPEVEIFTEYTPKLASTTFGSEEYEQYKKEMGIALQHHYANNLHHPEAHKNGVSDMTLLDLVEMFCDWKAASERQNNGNIRKSIEANGKRFNMSDQLIQIFENTVGLLDD